MSFRSIRRIGPRNQRGAGLIEVLVSVLVLAIGLLGVAAMQALSLRNTQSSLERTQAVVQTYSILDAMRANIQAARGTAYNYSGSATSCPAPGTTNLAQRDLTNWINSIRNGQSGLGDGACGSVACASGVCRVTIYWDDSRGGTRGEQGASATSMTTVVTL